MQLIVDIELVAMMIFWFLRGNSLRYAIVMAIVGISKILLNVKIVKNEDSFSDEINIKKFYRASLSISCFWQQFPEYLLF